MKKTLYMLIGLKGSGKSYIGALVAEMTDIRFLRVEPIWVNYLSGADRSKSGWEIVEDAIDNQFANCDRVMIESLGALAGWHHPHHWGWTLTSPVACGLSAGRLFCRTRWPGFRQGVIKINIRAT